jgi:hypothetical protein
LNVEGSLLSITGSASNLSELLFPNQNDPHHIDFNGGRTKKFYLAPILKFETYKQFVLSELSQKSNSGKQITDEALKRAAWATGGIYRSIQKAIEKEYQLFVEAAEMKENDFKWSLSELINKWSPETRDELWKPSPLWTILLMFDQNLPSNEVTLLSPSLPDFCVFTFRSIF